MFFKRNARILLTAMIALMLLFIWSNSFAGSKQSNALSGWVERWLKPLIDPESKISEKVFDFEVRKLAHFVEYAVLGALLVFGTAQANNRNIWQLLFVVLLAAVIDETIQIFSGRTSRVQDIWIDFSGAVIGILPFYCASKLSHRRRADREN